MGKKWLHPNLGISLGVVSENVLGYGRIRDDKERL
jgi:hypothetical protein